MKRIIMSLKKDQLQKAFEEKQSLKLTYKLKVNKEKFNTSNSRRRRALSESESNPEKIISNTISYKINEKQATGQNLEDVKLTYRKEMVPIPEIDGEVIKPQVPSLPELTPIIEYGSNLDFDEETIYHLPIEHGHYESNIPITISEDTKSDNLDIIVEGNIIDFVKDSITDNSYTKSGHNSADNNQTTVENTRSNLDIITINGQGEPIEFIEHTQTGISGQSEEITFIEETRKSEMTISGQSDSVEIIEDTQPGMSGFNKATVVDEDTRPKLQFHFDNEEPIIEEDKELPQMADKVTEQVPQSPITQSENLLPQTSDTSNNCNTFFTMAALAIIGAAGLLNKKHRENKID